jgi:hypothetical protein
LLEAPPSDAVQVNDWERRLTVQGKTARKGPDEATIIGWSLFGFVLVSAVTMMGLYLGFRH